MELRNAGFQTADWDEELWSVKKSGSDVTLKKTGRGTDSGDDNSINYNDNINDDNINYDNINNDNVNNFIFAGKGKACWKNDFNIYNYADEFPERVAAAKAARAANHGAASDSIPSLTAKLDAGRLEVLALEREVLALEREQVFRTAAEAAEGQALEREKAMAAARLILADVDTKLEEGERSVVEMKRVRDDKVNDSANDDVNDSGNGSANDDVNDNVIVEKKVIAGKIALEIVKGKRYSAQKALERVDAGLRQVKTILGKYRNNNSSDGIEKTGDGGRGASATGSATEPETGPAATSPATLETDPGPPDANIDSEAAGAEKHEDVSDQLSTADVFRRSKIRPPGVRNYLGEMKVGGTAN